MRKVLAMVMALAMMTTCAWAGDLDLNSYDDTALMSLLDQVQQEVVDRHLEKTAELQPGKYIGGRDIPSGTYVWTSMAVSDDWGNVTIYSLDENGGHDKQSFWEVVLAPEEGEPQESFLITINEGEELYSQIPFSLTIYAGPTFS